MAVMIINDGNGEWGDVALAIDCDFKGGVRSSKKIRSQKVLKAHTQTHTNSHPIGMLGRH